LNTLPSLFRLDSAPPFVIINWRWRYHHLGIPTPVTRTGEKYIPQYKMYVSGFSASPFGIEWMRFEEGCPLPELIQTVPHVAFEVEDIDRALQGFNVIFPPGSPSEGVRSAMIAYEGV